MLNFYPERRASAQEMLDHPWLTMPSNFDYKMTDREYEKMIMIKQNSKTEKKEHVFDEKDVVDSDIELNMGDDEDNDDIEVEEDEEVESYYEDDEKINIQNFNNSFSIYGQHVQLSALDKPNPQFEKKIKN